MTVIQSNRELLAHYKNQSISLGIGAFDGCHRGHQKILQQIDVAMTFSPTPKRFFEHTACVLTIDAEKKWLFPRFYFQKFNKEFSLYSPERFVDHVLDLFPQTKNIVIGWDFRFGKNQEGSIETLIKIADSRKISVKTISPLTYEGNAIKSTAIRECISCGKIEQANISLGYPFFITGIVRKGKQLGRTIGYPTINLFIPKEKLLPMSGVYLAQITLDKTYAVALSIGINPTTDSSLSTKIEGNILDYFGPSLYKQACHLELLKWISPHRKMASLKLLKTKIHDDVENVKNEYSNFLKRNNSQIP